MKIGIDIDDTITDSWECLIPYYSRLFNVPEDKLHKSLPYYESIKDKVSSVDEYYKIMLPIYDEVSPNVNLLPEVKETIDALYNLGCKVYFITSRGTDHTDAYKDSKVFLDRYHIKYEKIIVNAKDKAKICQEENISLFIDDSYTNCKEVSENTNTHVYMMTSMINRNFKDEKIKRVYSWPEIYFLINKEEEE